MTLNELLGYRLERRLHDAEIDYLIDEFRKHFPLKKDDLKELSDAIDSSTKERVVPRNLTDGYLVYQNWKRLTKSVDDPTTVVERLMANDTVVWKPFYDELPKYSESGNDPAEVVGKIKPHMDYLLDVMDGISDLCIAESVYQSINGNYERAPVLDGLGADGQIPIPEISETLRSGVRQTHKVALATETEPLEKLNLRDVDETGSR